MDLMISNASSNNDQHQQEAMGTAAHKDEEEMRNNNGKQQAKEAKAGDGSTNKKPRPPQDEALRCPRCESSNTKFCYYNNYSMSQPRYFCKACRRYWTQGGSLRNVPVGGGCRKNKRSSVSSASSSSSSTMINNVPMSTTTADFPNVLPTFMSAGRFELLPSRNLSLPLSNPPPHGGFLDILRGGFLDGSSSNRHGNGGFYDGNGNGMPPPPPSFGFGVMQHQHGTMGDDAAGVRGGGAAAAAQGQGQGQWPTAAEHGHNNGDVLAPGLQLGAHRQQLASNACPNNSNDVMMDSNNDSNGGSSTSSYWNNGTGGTRASPANNHPWQGGGLININGGSLI